MNIETKVKAIEPKCVHSLLEIQCTKIEELKLLTATARILNPDEQSNLICDLLDLCESNIASLSDLNERAFQANKAA